MPNEPGVGQEDLGIEQPRRRLVYEVTGLGVHQEVLLLDTHGEALAQGDALHGPWGAQE